MLPDQPPYNWKKELSSAFLSAFHNYIDLAQMVSLEFDATLTLSGIAGEGRLDGVVFQLIEWAEARGRLDELIAAADRARPGNLLIQQAKQRLAADRPGRVIVTSPGGKSQAIAPRSEPSSQGVEVPSGERTAGENPPPSSEPPPPAPAPSLDAIIAQITDPFIQVVERELRMDEMHAYWPTKPPAWNKSYTVVYFARQAKDLLTLRADLAAHHATLGTRHDSLSALVDPTAALLERATKCIAPISHIMDRVDQLMEPAPQPTPARDLVSPSQPRHPLSMQVRLAADTLTAQIQALNATLNEMELALTTDPTSATARARLLTQFGDLGRFLEALAEQLNAVSGAAKTASPYLN